MTFRKTVFLKTLLLFVGLGMIATLVGCSSSSGKTTTSPPPAIAVSLSTVPASLYVNDYISITATVTNDSANAGVTWSCSGATSCGAFSSPTSSNNTFTITYTAPSSTGTVTITATSVTDTTKSASTSAITINPASGITVTLSTPPPLSMPVSTTATITATVTNDSANAGVTWTASCGTADACGSFSSPTSSSNTFTVTYTAPSSIPTGGTVAITATSVTDDAQSSAPATVTIAGAPSTVLSAANYVFSLTGEDQNGGFYTVAGVFTVSSTGMITGGEQEFSDYANNIVANDTIAGGSVAVSSDGNLRITIALQNDLAVGVNGVETLDGALVSSSKVLIIEYDASATSSGELNQQAATLPAPSGGYAFLASGWDINGAPISFGGVINVDSAGGVSGNGSVFDMNDAANLSPDQSFSGSVRGPDSFGKVTFALNSSCGCVNNSGASTSILLDGYMIDAGHIRLVEDFVNDNLYATTGGIALGQSGTGTFNSNSISGSSFVASTAGATTTTGGPFQVAGLFNFNSDGSVGGNLSFNDLTNYTVQGGVSLEAESETTPCSSGSATTACYIVDPAGTGRVTVTNMTDGLTFNYNLQLYLTGDGYALVLSMDNTSQPLQINDVFSGLAWQQAAATFTAASFSGSYALDLTQRIPSGIVFLEQDGVGLVKADGVSALTGFLDINETETTLAPDLTLSGNFATTSTNGVFTGTITDPVSGETDELTYYVIDTTSVVVIENDTNQLTLGHFEL